MIGRLSCLLSSFVALTFLTKDSGASFDVAGFVRIRTPRIARLKSDDFSYGLVGVVYASDSLAELLSGLGLERCELDRLDAGAFEAGLGFALIVELVD